MTGLPIFPITLRVNGRTNVVAIGSADQTLLSVLRDDLQLMGSKEGCGIGVCGACTVLVDGTPVSSCIQLAVLVDGRDVTTIEGLATDGVLDPVQRAFISEGGLQCGICTPGQVIAARALLDEIPDPTEAEVRAWMSGNLCRCTGYAKIVQAVLVAAEMTRP